MMYTDKEKIVRLFYSEVQGKRFADFREDFSKQFKGSGKNFNGMEGYWLEELMGIKRNSNNRPDKFGYEQKKCSDTISFGDWMPPFYYYHKDPQMTRTSFIETFGSPNEKKGGRFSWSGKSTPRKLNKPYTEKGQRLLFDKEENLIIQYLHTEDRRLIKKDFPRELRSNQPITIASWERAYLETRITNKYAINGFYLLISNKDKVYYKIAFGPTIDFPFFQKGLEDGKIVFDSGMVVGNSRSHSQFRASKKNWLSWTTEEYHEGYSPDGKRIELPRHSPVE